MRLSKLEYAGRYDAMANELYKLTLLLLGEIALAQRSMAEVFVQGFRLHEGERFEESMLRVTIKTAAEYPVCFGEDYRRGVQKTISSQRLAELLCDLDFGERAALLLSAFELSAESILLLLGENIAEPGRIVLKGKMRHRACG